MHICPLCTNQNDEAHIKGADNREYHLCRECKLIFTNSRFHPSKDEEEERYKLHENGIQHKGYVDFLQQAIQPALQYIQPDKKGLDYGCGPNPTLSLLLQNQGYSCDDYDPIFFPNIPSSEGYDYIFSTECFEHFIYPEKDIISITKLLKSSGILIVMTLFWKNLDEFRKWFYTKDPTHVSFYHRETFEFICQQFGYKLLWTDDARVIILQKTA